MPTYVKVCTVNPITHQRRLPDDEGTCPTCAAPMQLIEATPVSTHVVTPVTKQKPNQRKSTTHIFPNKHKRP